MFRIICWQYKKHKMNLLCGLSVGMYKLGEIILIEFIFNMNLGWSSFTTTYYLPKNKCATPYSYIL